MRLHFQAGTITSMPLSLTKLLCKFQHPFPKSLTSPIPASPQMTAPGIHFRIQCRNSRPLHPLGHHPTVQPFHKFPTPKCAISQTKRPQPVTRSQPLRSLLGWQHIPSRHTAPRVVHHALAPLRAHYSRPCWIEVNVIQQRLIIVPLPFNQNRFIPIPKHTTPQPVPHIEPPSVGILNPFHALNQISFRGFNQNMIMIIHQDPGMDTPPALSADLGKNLQKIATIHIILKNRLAPIPPRQNMIIRPGIFNADTARHISVSLSHKSPCVNCKLSKNVA